MNVSKALFVSLLSSCEERPEEFEAKNGQEMAPVLIFSGLGQSDETTFTRFRN
jgi:hypothetical protein